MDFLAFRMSQTEETTIPPELWHYGKCFLGPCFVNELKRVCNNDHWRFQFSQFSRSVVSYLCDPMTHSTPGLPVHHQHLKFTQIHVHRVRDAIQPSHPLSSPPNFSFCSTSGWCKDLDSVMLNGLPWKGTETILSFLRLYPSTAFWNLLLTMRATPVFLGDSYP